MMFRVGQQVECIDDSGDAKYYFKNGDIFTVLGLESENGNGPDFIVIDCRPSQGGNRSWFRYRFRPIVSRKADISIFTAMLTPSKQRADA